MKYINQLPPRDYVDHDADRGLRAYVEGRLSSAYAHPNTDTKYVDIFQARSSLMGGIYDADLRHDQVAVRTLRVTEIYHRDFVDRYKRGLDMASGFGELATQHQCAGIQTASNILREQAKIVKNAVTNMDAMLYGLPKALRLKGEYGLGFLLPPYFDTKRSRFYLIPPVKNLSEFTLGYRPVLEQPPFSLNVKEGTRHSSHGRFVITHEVRELLGGTINEMEAGLLKLNGTVETVLDCAGEAFIERWFGRFIDYKLLCEKLSATLPLLLVGFLFFSIPAMASDYGSDEIACSPQSEGNILNSAGNFLLHTVMGIVSPNLELALTGAEMIHLV